MFTLSTTVAFSRKQIEEFGRVTGDDGPVHTVDGIVQGGLIISSLPKIFTEILDRDGLNEGYTYSVSMIMNAKFRKKLPADTTVSVDFSYQDPKSKISKLTWRVYRETTEYCSGNWVIYKARPQ